MKKYIYVLLLPLFLFTMNLFASDRALKPITIGTASGYAPFVSLNNKGEYEGFDIDVSKEIAQRLDRPLVLKDYGSMSSLLLALKQKKVDALIWAISITKDRSNKMEMIYYQGDTVDTLSLLFWNTIPENIKSFSDLGKAFNKTICVEAASSQEDILKTCPNISLKYLDTINNVVLDLKYGKSFAAAIDSSLIPRFQAKYPKLKVLSLPLPKELQSQGIGICLDRADRELIAKIRKIVENLREEGVISQLEKKWGLKDDK